MVHTMFAYDIFTTQLWVLVKCHSTAISAPLCYVKCTVSTCFVDTAVRHIYHTVTTPYSTFLNSVLIHSGGFLSQYSNRRRDASFTLTSPMATACSLTHSDICDNAFAFSTELQISQFLGGIREFIAVFIRNHANQDPKL